jgi:hypothetical protein
MAYYVIHACVSLQLKIEVEIQSVLSCEEIVYIRVQHWVDFN